MTSAPAQSKATTTPVVSPAAAAAPAQAVPPAAVSPALPPPPTPLAVPPPAAKPPPWLLTPLAKDLIRGRDLWLSGQTAEALAHFSEMEKKYPNSTAGAVGRMAVWSLDLLETSSLHRQKEYLAARQTFKKTRANAAGQNPPERVLENFLVAVGEGLHGFFRLFSADYIDGLYYSLRGLSQMEEVYYEDRSFVDALVGIGAMKFAKGIARQKTGLHWLFPDKLQEGIADLTRVAEEGALAKPVAPYILAYIHERNRDYAQAEPWVERAVGSYPNNCLIGQLKANILINSNQTPRALQQLQRLSEINCARPVLDYKLGFIHFYQTKDWPQAERLLKASLAGDFFRLQPAPEAMLGEIALGRGETEAARNYFQTAVKRYDDQASQQRLRQLKGK